MGSVPLVRVGRARLLYSVLLTSLTAASGSPAGAQSELVIHKEGTTEYHRPGCDVIRDGKGVVALTRAQAEKRGFKPHAGCDPETGKPASASEGAPAAKPETVYVNGTKYYHRKDCRRLKESPGAVEAEPLESAARANWPCPDCKPPIRKRNRASEPLGRVR
jgi:hypothetical protein